MSVTPCLPDDPGRFQQLLHDLLRRNDEMRRQAEDAQRRVDELQRVLDAATADHSQLQEKHAERTEMLALYRRVMEMETQSIDSEGRISLPEGFARSTVIIDQVSDTEIRIRKAVAIAEDEIRF